MVGGKVRQKIIREEMVSIKKDTEMIVHKFDGDIVIYALSDVHYGALEHNEAAWNATLKEILDQPNAYVILGGDLINNSLRNSVGAGVYDDIVNPMKQKIRMTEMIAPLAPRIICIVPGNHELRSYKETGSEMTYDIASKLNIEDFYRPNAAFIAISVGDDHNTYTFAVLHGSGGGIYTGATVNRNERFGNILNVDCLIVGHTHKGTVTRPSRLEINLRNKVVVQKEYLVVSMVSWMEYGGYAMQKMLLPSSHSNPQKLILRKNTRHDVPKRIEVVW